MANKYTLAEAKEFAAQASRGALTALGQLLRSLSADEVYDIPKAATGITGGSGTICKWSVHKRGEVIHSQCLIYLDGLLSSTTLLDIIGQGTDAAHLGQITAAVNGTILAGKIICLEAPVGGVTDIDLYSAVEATGAYDDAGATDLTETALVSAAAAWTIEREEALTALPAANEYLYLFGGVAGTAAEYTAGKFLIDLYGYDA